MLTNNLDQSVLSTLAEPLEVVLPALDKELIAKAVALIDLSEIPDVMLSKARLLDLAINLDPKSVEQLQSMATSAAIYNRLKSCVDINIRNLEFIRALSLFHGFTSKDLPQGLAPEQWAERLLVMDFAATYINRPDLQCKTPMSLFIKSAALFEALQQHFEISYIYTDDPRSTPYQQLINIILNKYSNYGFDDDDDNDDLPALESDEIYQLKITLKGSKPPIWRRLLVPSNSSFAQLHSYIQTAMGWDNSHLHAFKIASALTTTMISSVDAGYDLDFEGLDGNNEYLCKYLDLGSKFTYTYDFGDDWQHSIVVEKILERDDVDEAYPKCIAGKRACPPEDCGGIWGYEELLEILEAKNKGDKLDEDQEERLEYSSDLSDDPEHFDPKEVLF